MNSRKIFIPMDTGDPVSAILSTPDSAGITSGLVFAHGAANDMNNPVIAAVADGLANKGYTCLRFNFPYRENNKKSPDPEPVLVRAWQQAIGFLRHLDPKKEFPIIAVGKSLGARIAAQATAAGDITPDRLIFLGYPLHAPEKKETLRDAPLYKISIPMLFFEGTRDPFCDLDRLKTVFDRLSCPKALEIIDRADHSFALPGSDLRPEQAVPEQAVYDQIIRTCLGWLES